MRALVIVVVISCGCGLAEDFECGEDNANVSGEWFLEGEGELEECMEDSPDGDVRIEATQSFVVGQSQSSGADPLYLIESVAGISFQGDVNGDCVDFTIVDGGFTYTFEGNIDGNLIDGDFEADGFPGCDVTGTFEVTVISEYQPPEDGGPTGGDPSPVGDPDVGDTVGGDTEGGDFYHPPHECYRTEDCAEGICNFDNRCVPVCDSNADCRVGEKCTSRRCEDASTGCNCRATPWGGVLALAIALVVLSLRRRSRL